MDGKYTFYDENSQLFVELNKQMSFFLYVRYITVIPEENSQASSINLQEISMWGL